MVLQNVLIKKRNATRAIEGATAPNIIVLYCASSSASIIISFQREIIPYHVKTARSTSTHRLHLLVDDGNLLGTVDDALILVAHVRTDQFHFGERLQRIVDGALRLDHTPSGAH